MEKDTTIPKIVIDFQTRQVTGLTGEIQMVNKDYLIEILIALIDSGKEGLKSRQIYNIANNHTNRGSKYTAMYYIRILRGILGVDPEDSQLIVNTGEAMHARYYLYADVEIRNGAESRRIINFPTG